MSSSPYSVPRMPPSANWRTRWSNDSRATKIFRPGKLKSPTGAATKTPSRSVSTSISSATSARTTPIPIRSVIRSLVQRSAIGIVKAKTRHDTLYCDFDRPTAPRLPLLTRVLSRSGFDTPRWIRYDRTTHGWHVVIALRHHYTPAELVAGQLLLGSDARRERYNLTRIIRARQEHLIDPFWWRRWNLLFERKV
jgi:hypothetical protein